MSALEPGVRQLGRRQHDPALPVELRLGRTAVEPPAHLAPAPAERVEPAELGVDVRLPAVGTEDEEAPVETLADHDAAGRSAPEAWPAGSRGSSRQAVGPIRRGAPVCLPISPHDTPRLTTMQHHRGPAPHRAPSERCTTTRWRKILTNAWRCCLRRVVKSAAMPYPPPMARRARWALGSHVRDARCRGSRVDAGPRRQDRRRPSPGERRRASAERPLCALRRRGRGLQPGRRPAARRCGRPSPGTRCS